MRTYIFTWLLISYIAIQSFAKNMISKEELSILLENTKAEANQLKNAIIELYDSNIEKRFHNRIYSKSSLEGLKRKFANVLMKDDKKFIFGFTGDSVAAGHDCEHTQAYPSVFEAYFAPITKAAGLELEVRNSAVGKNPCLPYNFCVKAFVGDDCDVVTWDQGMDGGKNPSQFVEIFIRHSLAMKSQPAVLITDGLTQVRSKALLSKARWNSLQSKRSNLADLFAQFGVHWLSASEAIQGLENDNRFSTHQLNFVGKSYGNKSWHPGPYGHRVTGLVLATNYADVLIQVLEDLLSVGNMNRISYLQHELVDPSTIHSNHHTEFEDHIEEFQCATTFEPRYVPSLHLENFVSPDSILVDYREESLNIDSDIDLENTDLSRFWGIGAGSAKLAKGMKMGAIHGSLDKKFAMMGRPTTGPISFVFNSTYSGTNAPFWFCTPKKRHLLKPELYMISIDGTKAPFISSFGYCFGPGGLEIDPGVHKVTVEISPNATAGSSIAYALWWGSDSMVFEDKIN